MPESDVTFEVQNTHHYFSCTAITNAVIGNLSDDRQPNLGQKLSNKLNAKCTQIIFKVHMLVTANL